MDSPVDDILAFAEIKPHPTGRPAVTLSYAQSIDGSLTHRRGEPMALSGLESLVLTHHLRAAHDAILVGIGTVLADDPLLTTRYAGGRSPQPVVLDTSLRCPEGARLLQSQPFPWFFHAETPVQPRKEALESLGARAFPLPTNGKDLLDLQAAVSTLGELGIRSLMVEGGARVITSFLSAGLVDQVIITVAPLLVGGLRSVETVLRPFTSFEHTRAVMLGKDLVLAGKVKGR